MTRSVMFNLQGGGEAEHVFDSSVLQIRLNLFEGPPSLHGLL